MRRVEKSPGTLDRELAQGRGEKQYPWEFTRGGGKSAAVVILTFQRCQASSSFSENSEENIPGIG